MRAIALHPADQTRNTLAAIFGIALSVVPRSAAQSDAPIRATAKLFLWLAL
jgi:hypothetical protein